MPEGAAQSADEHLEAFERELAQALNTHPGHQDPDASSNSAIDEEMDDEQMEKLDQSLESIFRERNKDANMKGERKDAKDRVLNFKCRVLELLDIYVKKEHADPLTPVILLPALSLIRSTSSPLLSRKACDLIRDYARLCKGDRLPKVEDASPILDKLSLVHGEAGKGASHAHTTACSQASLLLVRILYRHDREHLRTVNRLYADKQEQAIFDPKCKVKAAFFTDWLNWCYSIQR